MNCVLCNILPNFNEEIILLKLYTKETRNEILLNLMNYTKLIDFRCDNCDLTKLPNLPNSLNDLYCYNNNLTKLPNLPNSLNRLACTYNKLNSTYFINTIYDENLDEDEDYDTCDPETEKYVFYYEYSSLNPLKKIKIINEINSKYRTQKRLKVLNRTLLLEHSARICLNPKRIKRLLDNNEIDFFDGSFDTLTN